MAVKLSPLSAGVVHSSAHRTRIKIPKEQRTPHNIEVVKNALLTVPGVQDVQVRPASGNIVIEHQDRADIIENIGDAIDEVAPTLLTVLTATMAAPGVGLAGVGLKGLSAFGNLLTAIIPASLVDGDKQPGTGTNHVATVKRVIPWAFLGAGVIQLIEGEALLAGLSPLILFYLAFDSHWKYKEEDAIATLQSDDATSHVDHKNTAH